MPAAIKRQREQRLRDTLREIRSAIDEFHRDTAGLVCRSRHLVSSIRFRRSARLSEFESSSLIAPDNYIVVPNHRGYDYLADKLASHGYMVVFINANRGITAGPGTAGDDSLILARGRLVLRHLQRLSEWNNSGGTPASLGVNLQRKLDFTNVGLMGHSRGGEGMRASVRENGCPSGNTSFC